ncbi:fumarylacetoacetate hydrolase family protein [Salinibacterium sp. G-O1]|uniref:fumarylacetoacetate hydrolase family protein n=1 Tax=Salinibacterium sp. G-O1 TaxID=3046208 RepID=UPI0024BAB63E|nr:fumarylacetoacetate hydrolase family protein [Salinibacterium sp. G-O1]MDJ0333854.1 fumarylacetoacetate hydrolase family protein [Salinibacterium sp. G-O1]
MSSIDRVARIATRSGPVAVAFSDGEWAGIHDPYADRLTLTGERFGMDVEFLAPCEPRVILGMAHNGPGDRHLPPQAFTKSARTAVGPGEAILLDSAAGIVNAEGELAVVMRRSSRHLAADDVAEAILGFTVANDVTAIEQVSLDSMMTQAKNGDGFTPLGPWIHRGLDPHDVAIDVIVNGERRVSGSTSDLSYGVVELIVYLTSIMTLGPGDVVLTGAPGTMTPISDGDEVSIALDGLGVLTNPVASLRKDPMAMHEAKVALR